MKTDTKTKTKASDLLPIPHPGETLKADFMEPLKLSAYEVAKAVGSTPITISMITRGKRSISAEMALRLGLYTGTGAEFWQNLQAIYDLRVASRSKGEEIAKRVVPCKQAA